MNNNYTPWAYKQTDITNYKQVSNVKKAPQLSIIVATDYIGGLDILFDSLEMQSCKGFEVIFVDALFKYRKEIIQEKSKHYNFIIKHLEPYKNIFPISNICNSINTGLINASSEFILLIKNYTYLPPKCVEKHLNFHLACPAKNIGFIGSIQNNQLPDLNQDFIKYEDIDLYAKDILENKLNHSLWSVFKNNSINIKLLENNSTSFMETSDNNFNGNNASFKLSAGLNVNGFNEQMDGTDCYQNEFFAKSLSDKLNFVWMQDENNEVVEFDISSIFPPSKKLRSVNINLNILNENKNNKFKNKINNYSLKMERDRLYKNINHINIINKKPKISVIVPTNRVGGLDILFDGLKNQSFQDFELILVDALYNTRKEIVAKKSNEYNFTVKHIEPIDNDFPISNYCRSINTGLINADGDIIYFTCDYSYLPKGILLVHSQFHANTPRNFILMMPINVSEFDHKKISNKFPMLRQYGTRGQDSKYQLLAVPLEQYLEHNKWSENYAEDIKLGKLDEVLWSIFDQEINDYNSINNIITSTSNDNKFKELSTEIPKPAFYDLCCLKNDSFKKDLLIEANGMNEALDGSHGFQDTFTARQLYKLYNAKFFALNNHPAQVINTRYFLEPRKIVKGYQNIKLIDEQWANTQPLKNNIITKYKEKYLN